MIRLGGILTRRISRRHGLAPTVSFILTHFRYMGGVSSIGKCGRGQDVVEDEWFQIEVGEICKHESMQRK